MNCKNSCIQILANTNWLSTTLRKQQQQQKISTTFVWLYSKTILNNLCQKYKIVIVHKMSKNFIRF